jgi:hypothetical protein
MGRGSHDYFGEYVVRGTDKRERATGKMEVQAVLQRLLLGAVLGSTQVCGGVVSWLLRGSSNLLELEDQTSLGNN